MCTGTKKRLWLVNEPPFAARAQEREVPFIVRHGLQMRFIDWLLLVDVPIHLDIPKPLPSYCFPLFFSNLRMF
ncbi:Uncharacterized protein APZ42_016646 [Daphnia magna]|uniref:Uncharacterized protein n=1 Tax=Daphnia magna TaxID=35525 RepID=A0A165ABB9_9CRUS|nr:Uncharacterized protein APZ42_016646 [Daphnia magna]